MMVELRDHHELLNHTDYQMEVVVSPEPVLLGQRSVDQGRFIVPLRRLPLMSD